MNPALTYIYARLSEPSTWRGIIALVTAAGVALSPDQVDKIVAAGLALIGLIGALHPGTACSHVPLAAGAEHGTKAMACRRRRTNRPGTLHAAGGGGKLHQHHERRDAFAFDAYS